MKKVKFFPLNGKKIKRLFTIFSVNLYQKHFISCVLKIPAISLMLRTRDITDIFNTFYEIYLVFTSKE